MSTELTEVRRRYALQPDLWRSRLVTCDGLAELASGLGVGRFYEGSVRALWRLGILRADYVAARSKLLTDGMIELFADDHHFNYLDARLSMHREGGLGSALDEAMDDKSVLDVRFHPFRLFVLHHVERTLAIRTSSVQYVMYEPGVTSIVQSELESTRRWTESEAFRRRFDDWNATAELAVASEFNLPWFSSTEGGKAPEHSSAVEGWIRSVGAHVVAKHREELALAAHSADPNLFVHVLLRLMSQREREKLKGSLGACMLFLSMAEAIRRGAEAALGTQLPEEDEIGLHRWMHGARRKLYGTQRVFDAEPRDVRDFLTSMGLDFSTKVRCYVEGDTEIGALTWALGHAGGVEFVNLRGHVVQRGGKGLAFIDSLKADRQAGVFSVVQLDGDRADYLRALKESLKANECFAPYFVTDPDFELSSFTPKELLEVVLHMELRSDVDAKLLQEKRKEMEPLLVSAERAETLLSRLRERGVQAARKGVKLGEALMEYALSNETLPPDHHRSGSKRPALELADLVVRGLRSGFKRSLDEAVVNVDTGRLERKQRT